MMKGETFKKNEGIMIPVSGPEEEKTESGKKSEDEKITSVSPESAYVEQLQRLQAEFSNYRKRVEKERESLFSTAKGELVVKLLPVLDDFERMLNHHQNGNSCSVDGVRMIYQNLKKLLMEEGLEEIPSVGEAFDPEFHEAVGVEETEADQDGMVLEDWQKGYRFGGRLLRPSRVKVGRFVDEGMDG